MKLSFYQPLSIWCMRVGMLVLWLTIIFGFLYLPKVTRLLTHKKSISLFIWPMILDTKVLERFEQETGIKVYVNYYETNEELYSKLHATKGQDYDLIVPTDYMVQTLIDDGLLKKLDMSKLDFVSHLKPYLLGHYFDAHNEYSVPYYTSIFGLGINKNYFGGVVPSASWALVFDQQKAVLPLSMLDSAREAIMLAGFYLFGPDGDMTQPHNLQAITDLLIKQKEWINVYTSARVEELLASGSCAVAVGTSSDIWKAMREYPNIAFIIPQEGSFVTIDSFVIPSATTKDDLVYQLLNFLYRPEIVAHNSKRYGFCPPTQNALSYDKGVLCPDVQEFNKLQFFKNILSKKQIQDTWIVVKSR